MLRATIGALMLGWAPCLATILIDLGHSEKKNKHVHWVAHKGLALAVCPTISYSQFGN